jgi:hypothetical protein
MRIKKGDKKRAWGEVIVGIVILTVAVGAVIYGLSVWADHLPPSKEELRGTIPMGPRR